MKKPYDFPKIEIYYISMNNCLTISGTIIDGNDVGNDDIDWRNLK